MDLTKTPRLRGTLLSRMVCVSRSTSLYNSSLLTLLPALSLLTALKAAPPDVPPSDTWAIFKRYEGEATGSYIKRLCLEGHRLPDAFLTIAASQIGQIMLATPASLWKAGLISGGLFTALAMSGSFFTIYL